MTATKRETMKTKRLARLVTDPARWCDVRETSEAVAEALAERATDASELERIWREPTGAELEAVVRRAWDLSPDAEELHWGVMGWRDGNVPYAMSNADDYTLQMAPAEEE